MVDATAETIANLLKNHRAFLRYLERRVGDRALAEDILQDAFAKVVSRPEQAAPLTRQSLRGFTARYVMPLSINFGGVARLTAPMRRSRASGTRVCILLSARSLVHQGRHEIGECAAAAAQKQLPDVRASGDEDARNDHTCRI